MFVFSSLSGDHRDLHSFPTRRSSDSPAAHRDGIQGSFGTNDSYQSSLECVESGAGAGAGAGATCRRRRDRKSTRLNSSHEWISYAVFCLKKKNNDITFGTAGDTAPGG